MDAFPPAPLKTNPNDATTRLGLKVTIKLPKAHVLSESRSDVLLPKLSAKNENRIKPKKEPK